MGSFTKSDDLPFEWIDSTSDADDEVVQETYNALRELLTYPFKGRDEVGRPVSKYNGATRVNILEIKNSRIVKSPQKFLTILKLFANEASTVPSLGLMVKKGSRKDFIHYVLELNDHSSVGIFFYDTKRMLSVPQVHNVERLINITGLKGGIIISNNIGIPAKQEARRINQEHNGHGIITIEHYTSLEKRYETICAR